METEREKRLNRLKREEEELKTRVYAELDRRRRTVAESAGFFGKRADNENCEEQYVAQTRANAMKARQNKNATDSWIDKIYEKPYYAHIKVKSDYDEIDYFLSDYGCFYSSDDVLIDHIDIWANEFDKGVLAFNEYIHYDDLRCALASKTNEPLFIKRSDGECVKYIPTVIRKVEIKERDFLGVIPLFPLIDAYDITPDVKLEIMLLENQIVPDLRDRLIRLQQDQLRIIRADIDQSFIVQGCVGAGVQQCLLHRLDYISLMKAFRNNRSLKDVLMITPSSQLSFWYQDELKKTYGLEADYNYSIEKLYWDYLCKDRGFAKNEYAIRDERHLPEEYLRTIYSGESIRKIKLEIKNAEEYYAKKACKLLGYDYSLNWRKKRKEICERLERKYEFKRCIEIKRGKTEGSTKHILELKKTKEAMANLEKTIFEEWIWPALKSEKDKNHVRIYTNGPESRWILYKSDLLYYLLIYLQLGKVKPSYDRILCIPEGQDLCKADYDTLRELFPAAKFNVFGDLTHAHNFGGSVTSWSERTGIGKVFTLGTNYRNPSSVVDFCNKQFGSTIEHVGIVYEQTEPRIILQKLEARKIIDEKNDLVVVVKDWRAYKSFLHDIGANEEEWLLVETYTDKLPPCKRRCYSIDASKGMEFNCVFVYPTRMTKRDKIVACTRAMEKLYYFSAVEQI